MSKGGIFGLVDTEPSGNPINPEGIGMIPVWAPLEFTSSILDSGPIKRQWKQGHAPSRIQRSQGTNKTTGRILRLSYHFCRLQPAVVRVVDAPRDHDEGNVYLGDPGPYFPLGQSAGGFPN